MNANLMKIPFPFINYQWPLPLFIAFSIIFKYKSWPSVLRSKLGKKLIQTMNPKISLKQALKRVQKAREIIGTESFMWVSAPRGFEYWMRVDFNLFEVENLLEEQIEAQRKEDRKPT